MFPPFRHLQTAACVLDKRSCHLRSLVVALNPHLVYPGVSHSSLSFRPRNTPFDYQLRSLHPPSPSTYTSTDNKIQKQSSSTYPRLSLGPGRIQHEMPQNSHNGVRQDPPGLLRSGSAGLSQTSGSHPHGAGGATSSNLPSSLPQSFSRSKTMADPESQGQGNINSYVPPPQKPLPSLSVGRPYNPNPTASSTSTSFLSRQPQPNAVQSQSRQSSLVSSAPSRASTADPTGDDDYFDDDFDLEDSALLELVNITTASKPKPAPLGPSFTPSKPNYSNSATAQPAWGAQHTSQAPSTLSRTTPAQPQSSFTKPMPAPSFSGAFSPAKSPVKSGSPTPPVPYRRAGPFVTSSPVKAPSNSQSAAVGTTSWNRPGATGPPLPPDRTKSSTESAQPKPTMPLANYYRSESDLPLPEMPSDQINRRTPSRVSSIGQRRTPSIIPESEPELPMDVVIPVPKGTSSFSIGGDNEPALPWSSSPAEHFQPMSRVLSSSVGAQTLQPPPTTLPRIDEESRLAELGSQGSSPIKPRRKRKLPWQTEADKELEKNVRVSAYSNGAMYPSVPLVTAPDPPMGDIAAVKDEQSAFPWNSTTTSDVKAQQRSLREANSATKKSAAQQNADLSGPFGLVRAEKVGKIFLSEEQRHVLNLVADKGQSVFFTGSAGTGKSVLLREIIAQLRRKYARDPDRIAVTASTGLAACNIGGVTLHSFSGIGLGKEAPTQLVKKIKRNPKAKLRWLRTKVLVVDEVSMLDADLFDKLEEVARIIRANPRPFGGLQLVITGDFFQLPPVPENGRESKFAFDAGSWATSIDHTIGLHHVFRQKDPVFAQMLNEMREGRMTPASIAQFYQLKRPLPADDPIAPTELFSTRREVDMANSIRMSQLTGQAKSYQSHDGGSITDPVFRQKLLDACMAPVMLNLKQGSQVMLIKNIDETLVNGSIGTIMGFLTGSAWNLINETGYQPEATCQAGKVPFFPPESDLLDQLMAGQSKKMITAMRNASVTAEALPIVRFPLPGGQHRDLLCNRETWTVEQPNGEIQASRSQVPLILAWALSIHKAQGQTIERVKVDLARVFERGQAYVALSRATGMPGLQVLNFDPRKVTVHERVREFYAGLSRIELKAKLEQDEKKKKKETAMSIGGVKQENDGQVRDSDSGSETASCDDDNDDNNKNDDDDEFRPGPKAMNEGQKRAAQLKKSSVKSYFTSK